MQSCERRRYRYVPPEIRHRRRPRYLIGSRLQIHSHVHDGSYETRMIHHHDKDSARKFKLKKESTMVYLDDKLETSDLKMGQWFPRRHDVRRERNQYAQSHESMESAKGCMKDMLEHYYTSTTLPSSPKTTQWERDGNYKPQKRFFYGSR
jgi:hypothetical protein